MQFNVSQLLKDPIGSIRKYELIEDLSSLEEFEALNPLVGTLQMLRTHSGILVSGEVSTALRVSCSRCLEPVVMPVRFMLEETFRPLTEVQTGRYIRPDEFEGTAEELEDEALLIDEHHMLKITEVVRQNIWLTLPMSLTCEKAGLSGCPDIDGSLGGVEIGLALDKKAAAEKGDSSIPQEGMDAESVDEDLETAIDPRWSALLALQSSLDDESPTIDGE